MCNTKALAAIFLSTIFLPGCVSIAPLSPMVTYGGPETTRKGTSETALALGTGSARFKGAHSGGNGWFVRYKYGLGEKIDIGIDVLSLTHSDQGTLTAKIASRYQLAPNFRLEGGIGAADDSQGKSLNGDIGLTWGTLHHNKIWNYYSTVRYGYAKGYAGNSFASDGSPSSDTLAPANTGCVLMNLGAQAKLNDNMKFIFEGGYGYLFPAEHSATRTWYISSGVLFNIGRKKE